MELIAMLLSASLAVIGAILLLIGTVFSHLLTDEFKAWSPCILEWLLRRAVAKLPDELKERYEEEWKSHLNETPGELGKIVVALGYSVAAFKILHQPLSLSEFVITAAAEKTIALLLLISMLPLLLLIAILIRVESKGSIFYREERVGLRGRGFTLYKFRCWSPNLSGARRPTLVGRIIGTFSLDELPQLLNVLRGDMKLIGPRPERPHIAKKLATTVPSYSLRHEVKPGITGWAQVEEVPVADKFEEIKHDLYYVKNRRLSLDLRILVRTIRKLFTR